jgi:hypothetical protein
VICDGGVVNSTTYSSSPLYLQHVPNLTKQFVRGLDPSLLSQYGGGIQPNGNAALPDSGGGPEIVSIGLDHTHSVGSHTHPLTIDAVGDHVHTAVIADSTGHFRGGGIHTPGGTNDYWIATGPGPNCLHGVPVTVNAGGGHSHTGTVGPAQGQTGFVNGGLGVNFDNRPPFVGLLKIIKVQ